LEGFGQNIPLSSSQTRPVVTIWALIADEYQHLCDDCFVLYPSLTRIKLVLRLG